MFADRLGRGLVVAVFCAFFCFAAYADEKAEGVEIAKFKDNKVAAICMSFSDSTPDHFLIAAPVLTKHGLKATFFTITSERSDTLSKLHILEAGNHEIASHTATHCPLTDQSEDILIREIKNSKELLEANCQQEVVTFGYPNCIRTEQLIAFVDQFYLYQAPPLVNFGGADFTLEDAMRIVNIRIGNNDELMICFHGIHPDMEGWLPLTSAELFEEIIVAIKELPDNVWRGMTIAELMEYTTLRDNCVISEQIKQPDLYQFRLAMPENMERYKGNITLLLTTAIADPTVEINGTDTPYTRLDDGRLMFDAPSDSTVKITAKTK